MILYIFLPLRGAQDVKMSCVCPSVRACITSFNKTLKMSSRELKQASKQTSRKAGRQAGKEQGSRQGSRQASRQASRQGSKQVRRQAGRQAGRQAIKQASTRNAWSRSHALEGLVNRN